MPRTTHGMSHHPLYGTWCGILDRCLNEEHVDYSNYGGRGISVCDRWLDVRAFISDMGARPDGASIDRIDVNKGYCPENCRWATRAQQNSNKRNTIKVSVGGVIRPLKEWCEYFDVPYHALWKKIRYRKLEPAKAISEFYKMGSYNSVVMAGNCTRDPEYKVLPSGMQITDLGIAMNERVKRGEEYVDEPVFVDVTFFGKTAEIAREYLSKGSQCLVSGRLKLDQWEANDGQKRSKLKVVGERLVLLGSKDGGTRTAGKTPAKSSAAKDRPAKDGHDEEEDVPF